MFAVPLRIVAVGGQVPGVVSRLMPKIDAFRVIEGDLIFKLTFLFFFFFGLFEPMCCIYYL